MLRVATFNVNGIRAASRRGFDAWLAGRGCDVVALQEVRCPASELPTQAFGDYRVSYAAGELAGRNGVALLTRVPPTAVRYGFGSRQFDAEGRYLEIDLDLGPGRPGLTVGSLYLPKGGAPLGGPAELARYRRKMRFLASFRGYLTRARRLAASAGREFLVTGDFNIAHTSLDLTHWRSSRNAAGFLPEEREWFGSILGPRTLTDVVRGSTRIGRAPTAGGCGASRPSPRTPAGGSTTSWPAGPSRSPPAAPSPTGRRRTRSGSATTPRSSSTTTSDG